MSLPPLTPPPGWIILTDAENPQGVRIDDHFIHSCNEDGCAACEHGAAYCETCRGMGWALTINCSGQPLNVKRATAVAKDRMDYIRGFGWVPVSDMTEA